MLLLQEKPLQYYKLLCRLASDSRESDRLTLQVKTIKQGAWVLEFWTKKICQDLPPHPPPPPLILVVEIKTWRSLIPKAMYKNLVLYELFLQKDRMTSKKKKELTWPS